MMLYDMMGKHSIIIVCCCLICEILGDITTELNDLETKVNDIMCKEFKIGGTLCGNYGIQNFVDSFSPYFKNNVYITASDIADEVALLLKDKIEERQQFLIDISNEITSKCNNVTSLPDFYEISFAGNNNRETNIINTEYSDVYGESITYESSTVRIPNNVNIDNDNVIFDAVFTSVLDDIMKNNNNKCNEYEYCAQYYGTINGVFRIYPSWVMNTNTDGSYQSYDPRYRPWYVSASTGIKNVIILLDKSGSMSVNDRWTIGVNAVESVLNTLGDESFVSLIAFDNDVTLSCFAETMVSATSKNIEELISFVGSLSAGGGTDFIDPINKAFDIFSAHQIANPNIGVCHNMILFLTDGIAPDPSSVIQARNNELDVTIFSYTLGSGADTTVPQAIADMTGGVYTHIDDQDTNLATIMASFYMYIAFGTKNSQNIEDLITISEPYLSFGSTTTMITMSLPIYINDHFVGVAGTDITLNELHNIIGDVIIGYKSYSFIGNNKGIALVHPRLPSFDAYNNGELTDIVIKKMYELEPQEFLSNGIYNKIISSQNGYDNINANVKQSSGDIQYNGYITYNTNLLYIYRSIGNSLNFVIAIENENTDLNTDTILDYGWDINNLPANTCPTGLNDNYFTTNFDYGNCLYPFNLFHELTKIYDCDTSFKAQANIQIESTFNEFWEGSNITLDYPVHLIQSGLFYDTTTALNTAPTCQEIELLHKVTNRLDGYTLSDLISINNQLPYNGIRLQSSIYSIYVLSGVFEFWRDMITSQNTQIVALWFGEYTGVHISFPGKQYGRNYVNTKRPWYQRAISNPDSFVLTTPYIDAVTGKLVLSGSYGIKSPNSNHILGVIGFDLDYDTGYKSIINNQLPLCSVNTCYIIDSSAFIVYYNDISNEDSSSISNIFFGNKEPFIMASLINNAFYSRSIENDYETNTEITYYTADDSVLPLTSKTFEYNNGRYSIYKIENTNTYLVYITGYNRFSNPVCPTFNCYNVINPGCVKQYGICKSTALPVCDAPETVEISGECRVSQIDESILQSLQNVADFDGYNTCTDNYSPALGTCNAGCIVGIIIGTLCCCGYIFGIFYCICGRSCRPLSLIQQKQTVTTNNNNNNVPPNDIPTTSPNPVVNVNDLMQAPNVNNQYSFNNNMGPYENIPMNPQPMYPPQNPGYNEPPPYNSAPPAYNEGMGSTAPNNNNIYSSPPQYNAHHPNNYPTAPQF